MSTGKHILCIVTGCGMLFAVTNNASADMDFSLLQLGSSSKQTQEQLAGEGFLFAKVTETEFAAQKLAVAPKQDNNRGQIQEIMPRTNYDDIISSTTISGKFCAGKLYELNVASYYEQQDETNFWAGRRQIYEYLQRNKAVMDKLSLSKKEGDANVGFQFNIDRSALGGSVKGVEIVNVMIDASGRGGLNQLQMKYRFTNKWFCPE